MMNRRTLLMAGALASGAWAVPALAAPVLDVVATTGMIADAARQVGGDLVTVQALMGPGVDPHSYRQTRTDIVAMTRADLVLHHGLYLEAQMESFFHTLENHQALVAVAEVLPRDVLRAHEDYDNKFDPHVWMSPKLWAVVVDEVRRALTDVAPEHADVFAANAEAHIAEVLELDAYCQQALVKVAEPARVLVTAHDAFGYFGQEFGFDVLGIQGISTESEAGLNRISALVDTLVDRQIGAVFVESSVSDRNIRALVEGAAAKGHDVRIGGELFSDAMGPAGHVRRHLYRHDRSQCDGHCTRAGG